MLYAGLDLSRKRLDFHLLDGEGETVDVGAAPPDADGLLGLTRRLDRHREPIRAAIESMNGARFVHDRLELAGWQVEIADAQKVKGLAPLACKTDRIDAWVLAELARRDLVPAIWLPDPRVRAERERARWRLHLVRHRSSLKQRVHAVLLTHGKPCPVSDLFGVRGRQLLAKLGLPEPWQGTIEASLRLIDELEHEITSCEAELRRLGADHRYVPLLCTVPGISWVLAYTIAAELGDISRFPSPRKLAGYSGLCPRVYQSGERDLRGPLAKQGPKYLRWISWMGPPAAAVASRPRQPQIDEGGPSEMVYAAIDIHKRIFQAAVLDAETGELVQERLPANREALDDWATRWQGKLEAVALEATTGWRWVARALQTRRVDVRLCDPGEARALGGSKRRPKTDRLDAAWLARLLAKEMLPEAWLPPAEIQYQFDPAGRLCHRDRLAFHLDDRLRLQLERLRADDLREAGAVAKHDERDGAEIALGMDPAGQRHPLAQVSGKLDREDSHRDHLLHTVALPVRAGGVPAVPPHFAASQRPRYGPLTGASRTARRASLRVVAVSRRIQATPARL